MTSPAHQAQLLNIRAQEQSAIGDLNGAISSMNGAINAQPKNPSLYFNRGAVLMDAKRYPEAIRDFD